MMNVLADSLKDYNTLAVKQCREIRFSNGGHLFACSTSSFVIKIFNFYTAESASNMECKGFTSRINSTEWFEDDSGFSSCDNSGNLFFFDLETVKEKGSRE